MTKVNLNIPSKLLVTVGDLTVGDYFSVGGQANKILLVTDETQSGRNVSSRTCVNISNGVTTKISLDCLVETVYDEVDVRVN